MSNKLKNYAAHLVTQGVALWFISSAFIRGDLSFWIYGLWLILISTFYYFSQSWIFLLFLDVEKIKITTSNMPLDDLNKNSLFQSKISHHSWYCVPNLGGGLIIVPSISGISIIIDQVTLKNINLYEYKDNLNKGLEYLSSGFWHLYLACLFYIFLFLFPGVLAIKIINNFLPTQIRTVVWQIYCYLTFPFIRFFLRMFIFFNFPLIKVSKLEFISNLNRDILTSVSYLHSNNNRICDYYNRALFYVLPQKIIFKN